MNNKIKLSMSKLPVKHQYILLVRSGALGSVMPLSEIANNWGISRQAVFKKEKFAVKTMNIMLKKEYSAKKIKDLIKKTYGGEE